LNAASTASNATEQWPAGDKLAVRYQASVHIAVIGEWL